ncbi:Mediator of RNA polymerase II transcription subunit 7 [Elasticomyces elasticus]|nr:Mediator of RNA polymerase II transcription subunit 7 [Elasticomyces elasticus]
MAEGDRPKALFPAPPPFYNHFTTAMLTHLRDLRKQDPNLDILSLPTELRYLIPPPPPQTSTFNAFGAFRSLNAPPQTLASLEVEQLYPDHASIALNPQAHLISLARTQLTVFLTLIGNLSQNPAEGWEQETTELDEITMNMLGLVNGYRPHQGRETLILQMEERIERLKAEMEAIKLARGRVEEVVGELSSDVSREEHPDTAESSRTDDEMARRKAKQRAACCLLDVPAAVSIEEASTMAEKQYLKISLFLKKQPNITEEFFHEHWKTQHVDVALRNRTFASKARKYNQVYRKVHVTLELREQARSFGIPVMEYDGIAEVWVDSLEDWKEVLADPDFVKAVGADEQLFILAPISVQLSYDNLVIPDKNTT